MQAWVRAIALVAISTAAAQVRSDEAVAAPAFKVGDTWAFSRNYVSDRTRSFTFRNEVKSVDGDVAVVHATSSTNNSSIHVYENSRARWLKRFKLDEAAADKRGELTYDGSNDESTLPFPLAVGKQGKHKLSWISGSNERGYDEGVAKVVRQEKVKTPAGEFDTFVVETEGSWKNETRGTRDQFKLIQWYAPAAKRNVKTDYMNYHQGQQSVRYIEELTSMSLAP